ncbi:MAG: hypothetical protein ACD_37C00161G0001, partial [uncultured bacterium]
MVERFVHIEEVGGSNPSTVTAAGRLKRSPRFNRDQIHIFMTILFLTRRFSPDIGGVEKHVLEIGKRLVQDNHKLYAVTQSQGKEKELEGI